MIINHKYRFIFLKTRKTAGTSISMALSRFCGSRDTIAHLNANDEALKKELGIRPAQNFVVPLHHWTGRDMAKFILGRGRPKYNEHMSAYSLMRRMDRRTWKSYFKFCVERNPFDKAISLYFWRTRECVPRPSFEEFLVTIDAESLSNRHIYTIGDEIAVDLVVQYQDLQNGLKLVGRRLGLGDIALPKAKAGIRGNRHLDPDLLSQKARDLIREACAWEIERFDYKANWCAVET